MGEILERNGSRTEVLADLKHLSVFAFRREGGTPGASRHFHASHVDAFVVLAGELEVLTAGDSVTLGVGELERAVDAVMVGEGERLVAELGGAGRELLGE